MTTPHHADTADRETRLAHLRDGVLFGAAYYHEYHREERLKTDLDLMVEAGFSVIRVGESVWSTWEPDAGDFDLDWLEPVLDGAHERGIAVVLGTPTYAVPMWLARQYPEINGERRTGQRIGWGARQEVDFTHAAFRFHAERIIRAVVGRYADHPAVIGYQVDNEPGNEILHNEGVYQRFADRLRRAYGTVDRLNEEWGLTYWSHRLITWADLWTADANVQPQYALEWRRFQADLTTEFIAWQAEIVRGLARPDQFVTTCIAYERPAIEDERLSRALDITSGNAYYRMQDRLGLPETGRPAQSWTTDGTWSLYATGDRMYASKQEPFLVTETNAAAIGQPWMNEPAFDGQWRQAAWALISRGAGMIEYWHWHTLPYGAETYWGGVLPHSLEPGRVYAQVAALGRELRAAGAGVTGLRPDAQVGLVYSTESAWALAEFPALGGSAGPDRRSFRHIMDAFYRGAFDAGLQARFLHPAQLAVRPPEEVAAALPMLVAAGVTILDDAALRWLRAYAEAGGHLVLGIRTGYEDELARARPQRKPAFLDEAAGAWYDEFSTIDNPVPVTGAGDLVVPDGSTGTAWIDGMTTAGAEVLAAYEHPHFSRWPAITTHAHGAGRVTYAGTVPDPPLAAALMTWVADRAGVPRDWAPQSPAQTVTGAVNATGEHLRFVHSWSWDGSVFTLPAAAADIATGQAFASGSRIELGPWDVRVLVERA